MNINDVMNNEGLSGETIESVSRETISETSKPNFSFFRVPSLDKPIEDYFNHPFNKESDEDLAQGLRGVEAYMGNTNLAIMDLFGLVKYILKKLPKRKVVEDEQSQP